MDNETIVKAVTMVEQHSRDINDIKNDVKEIKKKNDLLYELSVNIKTLAENLTEVKDDVSDIKKSQNALKGEISDIRNAPIKNKANVYDKIVVALCSAVLTGVIAFILAQVCPTIFS